MFLTAHLGLGGHGGGYVLRRPASLKRGWRQLLLGTEPVGYTYRIADRDETGARALSALESQASCRPVSDWWRCTPPRCWPEPAPAEQAALTARGLYDLTVGLSIGNQVVGHDIDGDAPPW